MIEKAGAGKPAPVFFYTVSAFALILSIGDLFDDIQRIDKATCGKNIPQTVNSIFQFACNHINQSPYSKCKKYSDLRRS